MNYVHHAIIGSGTAAVAVLTAEALGAAPLPALTLGIGALAVAGGSIATDLDHPRSFIANSIPGLAVRIALAVLAIPLLAALGALLTTRDLQGSWDQLLGLVFGIQVLRWALLVLLLALGLMGLSWLLYKSLHHRGPLHSLLFAAAVTVAACVSAAAFGQSWLIGLAFGWGWTWHILADGLTPEGVPLFWPFSEVRSRALPRWVGTLVSTLLTLAGIAGMIVLILQRIQLLFV
jgi:membrane-bound metal-dependent hydrolase YbcI (DUF457 family)